MADELKPQKPPELPSVLKNDEGPIGKLADYLSMGYMALYNNDLLLCSELKRLREGVESSVANVTADLVEHKKTVRVDFQNFVVSATEDVLHIGEDVDRIEKRVDCNTEERKKREVERATRQDIEDKQEKKNHYSSCL